MRVAWILYGSLEQRTGGTLYDKLVVSGLREQGDVVDVIALRVPKGSPDRRRALGRERGIALGRALRRSRPDVVVGDELCFPEIAAAYPLLGRSGVHRVLLVHHLTGWEAELSSWKRREARRLERMAIEASDQVLTTSRTTLERLASELGGPRRRTF